MFCPACRAEFPAGSTFCFQCGAKIPGSTPTEAAPAPPAAPTPAAAPRSEPDSSPEGGKSKLSEDVGALGCSILLFFGGGGLAVMESKWGKWALVVGGLLAVIGLITGNATFWAILKRLWSRK